MLSLHFIPQFAMEGDFFLISYFCVNNSARSKSMGGVLGNEDDALLRTRLRSHEG